MPLIPWPKNIKLSDVVDAIDDLTETLDNNALLIARNNDRIAALETYAATIIQERTARIETLEAQAIARQHELDQLKASDRRTRWAMKTGRKP